MKTNRRNLLRGAAVTGLTAGAGALAACDRNGATPTTGDADDIERNITQRTVAEAEKLQGISYAADERAMMLEDLEGNIQTLANLREIEMPNDLAPALTFNPRLPRKRVRSQKNVLQLNESANAPFPDNATDIAYATVAEQGAWLRSGDITSAQLTEIYLARIGEHDTKLRAFITVTPEIAREQAAKADKEFANGRDRGPLHGIPYGLKDLADVKGVRTTWGATPYKDRVGEVDAEIVRKLERAGAVLLGKTALGAIAYGDQWFDARTANPWNPNEGSSGSSAGSAAAVAAGLASFAIGTETLGSLISPSERCGTATVRPTFGRVSRAGLMALCWSLDKAGPIVRDVEDNAIVLAALNGYDADDPATARVGFTYDGSIDIREMTVGFVPEWFEQADSVDRAALDAARDLGVTIKEFPWPTTDINSLVQIVLVESAAAFSDLTLSDRDDELVWQDRNAWPNSWRAARFISAVDYVQMDRLRRRLMTELNDAFDGFDALLGPNFGGGALLATNMSGHPQLAFRAGFAQTQTRTLFDEADSTGETFRTPRAVSLWGDLFQEGKLIALARALEKNLGAAKERPPAFA